MQGLKISIAKRLNRIWGRGGSVFVERYHVREIATPRQARHRSRERGRSHGNELFRRRLVNDFSGLG
jgi:hypothetical protein